MLPLTFTAAGEATLLKLLRRPIGGHATPRTEPEPERQRDRAALSHSSENVCTHTDNTLPTPHTTNTTNTTNINQYPHQHTLNIKILPKFILCYFLIIVQVL